MRRDRKPQPWTAVLADAGGALVILGLIALALWGPAVLHALGWGS